MANDVQFDEWRPGKEREIPPSGMVKFVMKYLGVTSEHSANALLLLAACVFFVLTAFVIFRMIHR